MPLVLVHNDFVANPAHQWDDVEGVHYHYPSKYRSKVHTGEPFVYYRGVYRADGRRGPAEYVGAGRIGNIWADPDRPRAYYCAVENYRRFRVAVPAKVDGVNREVIASNLWRDGIRSLDPSTYAEILSEGEGSGVTQPSKLPAPLQANIEAADDLIIPAASSGPEGIKTARRISKRAKAVGDWAEAIALRFLSETNDGRGACIHRAAIGETPGWDIDYVDANGVLQRVEVKGTISAAFRGVELTAGELLAARRHRETYWLCLVARCETDSPKVQLIQDPFAKLMEGSWTSKALLYALKFSARSAVRNERNDG